MCELHGGKVVHDSNVDEALGILHDTEDGLEVLSPASWTEGWRGTLTESKKWQQKWKKDLEIMQATGTLTDKWDKVLFFVT